MQAIISENYILASQIRNNEKVMMKKKSNPWGQRAVFSDCEKYRFWLERQVSYAGEDKPRDRVVVFAMLNPSTADAQKLNPTCNRCFIFAHEWGFDRLVVVNAYALRSTDPKGLKTVSDPVGRPENDWYIRKASEYARNSGGIVVCAWGNHAKDDGRADEVFDILSSELPPERITALKVNASGMPSHPLYLRSDLRPKAFSL